MSVRTIEKGTLALSEITSRGGQVAINIADNGVVSFPSGGGSGGSFDPNVSYIWGSNYQTFGSNQVINIGQSTMPTTIPLGTSTSQGIQITNNSESLGETDLTNFSNTGAGGFSFSQVSSTVVPRQIATLYPSGSSANFNLPQAGSQFQVGGTNILAPYLTSANAAATYLTQNNASNTYTTIVFSESTYLSQEDATLTYLTKDSASSTYLTQANAASTYISQATGNTLYAPKTPTLTSTSTTIQAGQAKKQISLSPVIEYATTFLDTMWIHSTTIYGTTTLTFARTNAGPFTADNRIPINGIELITGNITPSATSVTYLCPWTWPVPAVNSFFAQAIVYDGGPFVCLVSCLNLNNTGNFLALATADGSDFDMNTDYFIEPFSFSYTAV